METQKLTNEQRQLLDKPLPAEAVSQHPTKKYLSSIKSIYVTERFNDVFGVGQWRIRTEFVERVDKMVVIKVLFSVPAYGIEYECYGGNDNTDTGDAYKGATTDAITKIGSWLGIGAEVFKDKQQKPQPTQAPAYAVPAAPAVTKNTITMEMLDDPIKCDCLMRWGYTAWTAASYEPNFDVVARLLRSYEASKAVCDRFRILFDTYKRSQSNGRK